MWKTPKLGYMPNVYTYIWLGNATHLHLHIEHVCSMECMERATGKSKQLVQIITNNTNVYEAINKKKFRKYFSFLLRLQRGITISTALRGFFLKEKLQYFLVIFKKEKSIDLDIFLMLLKKKANMQLLSIIASIVFQPIFCGLFPNQMEQCFSFVLDKRKTCTLL